MFHFSTKLFTLIAIFSCLFFYAISCGQNTAVSVSPTFSTAFQQFINANQEITPEQFCQWWNSQASEWTFSYYGENGLKWPDYSTAEEIFYSKVVNCYRISKLCQAIYGGELIFVSQPESRYDHYYLQLRGGKIDSNGLILKYIGE